MRAFRLIPDNIKLHVIGMHRMFFVLSLVLILGSLGLFFGRGLNLGIDFLGGTLIEAETAGVADIGSLRGDLNGLGLGEVSLQQFGADNIVLIRLQDQLSEQANLAAIRVIKDALGDGVVEYRRTETVGPVVGGELQRAALWAVSLAILAIMVYIWFRFEWQFGISAFLALVHDVLTTVGLFALLGLEFNLATVAAILTIAGYSINDTVVVFDRIRENLRKYHKLDLGELFDMSINQTFSRTFMTSITTLAAVLALAIFGGSIIRDFAVAMAWGVLIGTYSSVALAAPSLLYMGLHRDTGEGDGQAEDV